MNRIQPLINLGDFIQSQSETSNIFTPDKSVVIVGNGPSALNGKRGAIIDKFDLVVRFNQFIIDGYENKIGSKTSVWCRNEGPHGGDGKNALESGAHTMLFALNEKAAENSEHTRKHFTPIFESNESISSETWGYVQEQMQGHIPSSGQLAITHVLQFIEQVHVVGFDCMAPGRLHYFEEKSGSAHLQEIEEAYFDLVLSTGRVHIIPE